MAIPAEIANWQRMSVGASARDALSLIEDDLRQAQYQADQKAYAAIMKGGFTAELAFSLFHEKYATYSLQKKLMQQAKQGESAATNLREEPRNG